MAGRWMPAQDLFDQWSAAEDELAFDRAGGHAYNFELTPPVSRPRTSGPDVIELDDEDVDEFELEEALLDSQTTAALRIMSAELTGSMELLDDDITGTLPAMA